MTDSAAPIACNLGALAPADRARRAALAEQMLDRVERIEETVDGFALRVDASLARDSLEWFLLERRCCPFLRLELDFAPGEGPLWLRLRGGPGVKEFLAGTGLAPSSRKGADSCGC
jgi:hypothetical protein